MVGNAAVVRPLDEAAPDSASHLQAVWNLAKAAVPAAATLLVLAEEDIGVEARPGTIFRQVPPQGWRGLDLDRLPEADGIVLAGGLAGLLAVSFDHACETLSRLLLRHRFAVFDLCSFTETADAACWRPGCGPEATGDPGLRRGLLGPRATAFKLGSVPAKGGLRSIYKAYGQLALPSEFDSEAVFQRNHASWPHDKRLIDDGGISDAAAPLAQHVSFRRAVSADGDRYWIKSYTEARGERIAALEQEIGLQAKAALDKLARMQPARAAMLDLVLPLARKGGELLFTYDPDLFPAGPSHLQDWSHFLPPDILRSVTLLAAISVPFRRLKTVFLHNLCDFQVAQHGAGVSVLDFEPNPWVTQLLGEA